MLYDDYSAFQDMNVVSRERAQRSVANRKPHVFTVVELEFQIWAGRQSC